MASEIKANKISPATGTAFTIGDSGDTFTLPSGATLAVASGATISNAGTASGFGGNNTPYFSAYRGSGQVFSASTYVKVLNDTEVVDSNGAYDNATNYRFTVPAGQAGKYYFSARASVNMTSPGPYALYLYIFKNGSPEAWAYDYTGSTYQQALEVDCILNMAVNDYAEMYVFSSAAGTLTLLNNYTQFLGFKLVE